MSHRDTADIYVGHKSVTVHFNRRTYFKEYGTVGMALSIRAARQWAYEQGAMFASIHTRGNPVRIVRL